MYIICNLLFATCTTYCSIYIDFHYLIISFNIGLYKKYIPYDNIHKSQAQEIQTNINKYRLTMHKIFNITDKPC